MNTRSSSVIFLVLSVISAADGFVPLNLRSKIVQSKARNHDPKEGKGSFELHFKREKISDSTDVIDAHHPNMDKITEQRPYGLFILEKVAEFAEKPKFGDLKKATRKEKVVILGTGWGAAAFLKNIDTDIYDVTVVSPRNYFLFTPMLAGATVGTVEYRSITEPIREINPKVSYLEGSALYVDPKEKTVIVKPVECDGNHCGIQDHVEIEFDRLVFTIGAQTNTFGIPGVKEHCNFLKQVDDARRIRAAIVNCFERAGFPELTEDEKTQFLTFAIIGAGPSGIEFAAELRDFVEQDGPKYYPKLLKYVRIKVIEASNTVLAPFHKTLQKEAIHKMNQQVAIKDPEVLKLLPPSFNLTELMLGTSVKEVTEKSILLKDGSKIEYGLAVWAAGNAPLPLTLDLIEELGEHQAEKQHISRGRIAIDPWLRAIGSDGSIFSLGDASCLIQNQVPATGQVAAQQGEYLARLFNKQYYFSPDMDKDDKFLIPPIRVPGETHSTCSDKIASLSTKNYEYAKPFQYLNLGILAYTGGDTALAQVTTGPRMEPITATGKVGSGLWKSIYIWKQVSWRNRLMVLSDWTNRQIFGRDITHLD